MQAVCVLQPGKPPASNQPDVPAPRFDLAADRVTMRGCFVGYCRDRAAALGVAAAGKVKADIERQLRSAINRVLRRLADDEFPSCWVLGVTSR
jgi:propanol-preferring alcohol dehydrogenase